MVADPPSPSFERYAAEPAPQAAIGAPGRDGVLELTFERTSHGTTLVHDYATVPFHISGTLSHGPHPGTEAVFVQSPTDDVTQGDRHDLTIAVETDAIAHVSTQSSTKVQTMERNYAGVDTTLSVTASGHLDYAPEPTTLHTDARYTQDLCLDVTDDVTTIVGDVVVSGRLARGRRFEFDRYHSRLHATDPDGLLFEDATHLAPDEPGPSTPGLLGEHAVCETLLVVASSRDTASLSDDLHEAAMATGTRAGVTKLSNDAGVAVRALSSYADTVRTTYDVA